MSDVVDRASNLEEMNREQAIKANQQHEKPLIVKGIRRCLECEETILMARIQSVNAVRCISCQELHEHQQKYYARTGRQF